MDEHLVRTLKYLRLPNLLARWDDYLGMARKRRFSSVRLLRHVLEEECRAKRENARKLRLKRAKIPEILVMGTFPFSRQPKLDKKRILSLYDAFDFVEKRQNLIWVGPTGCGKTGLATSFLVEAIQRGHTGRYVLFPELVAELYASVADHSEEKVLKRYLAYDCLLIDEVGYVEVEAVQVGLFFTLMHRRHRKKPTLITSNLGFGDWRTFLKNDHLAAALIDRLTENSHVFNMKNCISLRSKLGQDP
ncbi:ATP-binding protein [Planctomycetota bacterium]